jgi:hypothetical protein
MKPRGLWPERETKQKGPYKKGEGGQMWEKGRPTRKSTVQNAKAKTPNKVDWRSYCCRISEAEK